MTKTPPLFPITHWLLNAAAIFFLILSALFIIALGAVGVAWFAPQYLHFPDTMAGVTRSDILAIAAPAVAGGLVIFAILALIFRTTATVLASAMSDDPFIDENARRLSRIGWLLVAQAGVQAVTTSVLNPMAQRIEAAHHTINIDDIGSGVSPVSILTILLVFVLAQIFRRGAEMRSELEATV